MAMQAASHCIGTITKSEEQVKLILVIYTGNVMQEGNVGVVRSGDEVPQQLCIL